MRGTAIDRKMAPPYAIIFLGDLNERIFSDCDILPLVCGRYIDDIFMFWQHELDTFQPNSLNEREVALF